MIEIFKRQKKKLKDWGTEGRSIQESIYLNSHRHTAKQ